MILKRQSEALGATCVALFLNGYAGVSVAQETPAEVTGLEEVIVTAEKVATSLQETPVSVAAISGEKFAQIPAADLRSALSSVPGITVSNQGNFNLAPVVRGIGPGILNGQNGVTTLYDGVFSSSPLGTRAGYYDIARLEVLLGPQGTLYGKNAEGGVVHVITNDPTSEFEGSASAGFGNYHLKSLQGMVNVPISDTLSLRVAGQTTQREGFLSNGQDDNHSTGMRAKLLFTPSDKFSILLAHEEVEVDEKGTVPVQPFLDGNSSAFDVPYTPNQFYRRAGRRSWATINADVGIGNLTVIPSYGRLSSAEQLTYAQDPSDPSTTDPYYAQVSFGNGRLIERSAEARLSAYDSSPIKWIIGAYGYDSDDFVPGDQFDSGPNLSVVGTSIVLSPTATASNFRSTIKSTGAFAQVTVPVVDSFRIVGGVRRSKDEATYFNDGGAPGTAGNAAGDWARTDYRLGAQYDVADDSMLYATFATGYRPGGFSPAPPYPTYDVETVKSYEVGSKNEFLENTLRVNGSVYYYDYNGFQQITFQNCGGAGQPACTGPIPINLVIQNVDKVTVKGAELSVLYAITPADTLTTALSYNDSSIDSDLIVGAGPGATNVRGSHLPRSPLFAGNVTYSHGFQVGAAMLTPELTASYSDEINLALPDTPIRGQEAVWTVDAQIGYVPDDANWRINLWGKNLSNEVIKGSGDGVSVYLAEPRTYGASVTASF